MDETLREIADHVNAGLSGLDLACDSAHGELTIHVEPGQLLQLLKFLRDDPGCRFVCLIDVCGVDWPGRERRFDVVYHLLSPYQNARVRVKTTTDEDTPVPSAIDIYPAAGWYEREAYDLYGIFFSDHPDLRRILTDYGFDGHPLRKDFPLTGHVQVRYDETRRKVVQEPVELNQEYRSFDYLSPWEGPRYDLPGDEKAK